jgi:hypothetical protein
MFPSCSQSLRPAQELMNDVVCLLLGNPVRCCQTRSNLGADTRDKYSALVGGLAVAWPQFGVRIKGVEDLCMGL